MNTNKLLKIIGAVAVINLISRFFGFVREVVIGYHFGTSFLADSVITAYTIPNFLYIVAGGAITTAFISVFNKAGNPLVQTQIREVIFTYTLILFSLISAAFFLFPDFWIELFFMGLNPEEVEVTGSLFRIMAPATLLLILSMFYSGILNVNDRFQITATAPLMNNLLFVLIALVLFPILHEHAYGWGALIGAVVMILMLVVNLRKIGISAFRFRFYMEKKDHLFRFLKIAIPILLGGATLQFYFLVHRVFASSLEAGYIAALNYASKLVQLPQSILMSAVTTVIYPLIARKISEGKQQELSKMYGDGIQYLLFLMIPSTVFLYFYSEDIVTVIFEYGTFDRESSIITSGLLEIFVFGMFAHAANLYVTRFFYAMERAVLPVISGVLAVFGLNILIVVVFIDGYGAASIAWGTTISAYFQLIILMFAARRSLKLKLDSKINLLKQFILAALLAGLGLAVASTLTLSSSILNLLAGLLIIGSGFIIGAYLLRIKEIQKILSLGRGRKRG
ncbi:murein biosynthesis integral membrane protein MurJ [Bacillus dakarensis]|uniref:murein biosynthesis integral membrane protein MurJ n=1 Tax=Robertmurraya dakarensis TaxID=1926278 RepID=UPI0009818F3A|nr:murein biosynthesis integral membrane protein MurJ [Bacillus dakarensis]